MKLKMITILQKFDNFFSSLTFSNQMWLNEHKELIAIKSTFKSPIIDCFSIFSRICVDVYFAAWNCFFQPFHYLCVSVSDSNIKTSGASEIAMNAPFSIKQSGKIPNFFGCYLAKIKMHFFQVAKNIYASLRTIFTKSFTRFPFAYQKCFSAKTFMLNKWGFMPKVRQSILVVICLAGANLRTILFLLWFQGFLASKTSIHNVNYNETFQ